MNQPAIVGGSSRQMRAFHLALPPVKILTQAEKLTLLEDRHRRGLASPAQRRAYSRLLMEADRFEDAIQVLGTLDIESEFGDRMALGNCYLARQTTANNLAALDEFEAASILAQDARGAAAALAEAGKACMRLDRRDDARRLFHRALEEDNFNSNAFKRLNVLEMMEGRAEQALADTEKLMAGGVRHARLLCGRALALAAMNRFDEARAFLGLEEFLREEMVAPPAGWHDTASFNRDLAKAIVAHPGKSGDRYGAASVAGTRLNEPMISRAPLFREMLELLRRHIGKYISEFGDAEHPLLDNRPSSAVLRAWVVMTEADGYEEWHVHQNGWISGVYYVEVPGGIARANDEKGCLCFGLQPDIVGEDKSAATGQKLVRPLPGKLLIFPSHVPHRTFLHGQDERRICVAFDVVPAPASA